MNRMALPLAGDDVSGGAARADVGDAESGLLRTICTELLANRGVDAGVFFARLESGDRFPDALGVSPALIEHLYARACQWLSVRRPDKAGSLFHTLCLLAGDVADHWVGLGICQRLRGRWDSASVAFQRAEAICPRWAIPALHRAEMALALDDTEQSREHMMRFDKLVDDSPNEVILAEARRIRTALNLRQNARGL